VTAAYDLLVAGRPSVDVMFSALHEWPALGKDVDADGIGICAGTAFNTPAAANRLGLRVAFVATIGNDAWSQMIHDEFEAERLPTVFLSIEDRPLPGVSVALNRDGDRGFVTHWGSDEEYGSELAARALDVALSVDARHLHSYVNEAPPLEAVARERGMTVSLDSWGGPWWSSERPLGEVLEHADVLFANEREALAMSGASTTEEALERLADHVSCVAIKRGPDGAIASAGGAVVTVPSERVDVVDTTGAGDCFNAGFLLGWLGGLELEASVTLGVLCGERAVADYGGYRGCPRGPELRELAAARGVSVPDGVVAR
jgi:sugar/nucleoside kinase (ribokinase family)